MTDGKINSLLQVRIDSCLAAIEYCGRNMQESVITFHATAWAGGKEGNDAFRAAVAARLEEQDEAAR